MDVLFVSEHYEPIALAVFAAVSLAIIASPLRARLRASLAADRDGVRKSVIASIAFSVLFPVANVVLAAAAFVPSSREGFWLDYALSPFVYLAGLASLAAIDGLMESRGGVNRGAADQSVRPSGGPFADASSGGGVLAAPDAAEAGTII